jgi:hypothetical protein
LSAGSTLVLLLCILDLIDCVKCYRFIRCSDNRGLTTSGEKNGETKTGGRRKRGKRRGSVMLGKKEKADAKDRVDPDTSKTTKRRAQRRYSGAYLMNVNTDAIRAGTGQGLQMLSFTSGERESLLNLRKKHFKVTPQVCLLQPCDVHPFGYSIG